MTQDTFTEEPIDPGAPGAIDYDRLTICDSASRARRRGLHTPIGVVGHIQLLGETELIDDVPHHRMMMVDQSGKGFVHTFPFSDPDAIEAAERAARSGTRIIAF